MSMYGAILPGAARVARLPGEVHPEALRRWKVVHWCRQHGNQVRLTARYFGFSPDTVSRWVHAFEACGMAGLRPGSRRPKRVRQPQTPLPVVLRIQELRERHPCWGREKLRRLLAKEGIELSAKSTDRVLSRLRKRGLLFEPLPVRQAAARRQRSRPRRPPDLVVDGPGVLVQFDSKHVVAPQGRVFYEFGAIDCFSRQRVVELFAKQDSRAGAEFLERVVDEFPFPIQAIQTDGGSEFLGQFEPKVQQLRLVQYWNGPNYPQGNGRIERSFGTDEREFWRIGELPNDLAGLRVALADWNRVYHSPFDETSVWALMLGRGNFTAILLLGTREVDVAEHINGPLHWEQLGRSGRPIAFVHPNPMDYSCWLYQMAHLSTWFKTIGIDLPGYGRSPTARPGLTMDDIAQACWEAVDEVTDELAIVVGCSVGSVVVQYMASQRPQRTLAVVVSGSRWRLPRDNVPRRIAQYQEQGVAFRYQHTFEDYSLAFRQTDYARYFAELFTERNAWADAATIVQMMRANAQADPESLAENIKAPMLIIMGSEDNSQQAFALQERVSGCELVTIQGAGHACYMERPWEWDARFLDFLARHGLFEGERREAVASG